MVPGIFPLEIFNNKGIKEREKCVFVKDHPPKFKIHKLLRAYVTISRHLSIHYKNCIKKTSRRNLSFEHLHFAPAGQTLTICIWVGSILEEGSAPSWREEGARWPGADLPHPALRSERCRNPGNHRVHQRQGLWGNILKNLEAI